MTLDEARLKPHTVTRPGGDVTTMSGMSAPEAPTTFEVLMDLQADGQPRFSSVPGVEGFVGGFTGFTYDDRLALGDQLLDTPHGALRVEAIELWDDEEPSHYQVGLVPA